MRMLPVTSSNVTAIGHEGTTPAVTFKNGATYHYAGVGAAAFHNLLVAESKGRHLNEHIIPHHAATKQEQATGE